MANSTAADRVLITGASGLLGRALIPCFLDRGFAVLAQYHTKPSFSHPAVTWIAADFADRAGISSFLQQNDDALRKCACFVHAYGPLTPRATAQVDADTLQHDFHHNVLTAAAIVPFLLAGGRLQSVVTVGFTHAGRDRAFRGIAAYAAAKNALLLLTRSWAAACAPVRFNMVSPAGLAGARFPQPGQPPLAPETVARRIVTVALGRATGRHFRLFP